MGTKNLIITFGRPGAWSSRTNMSQEVVISNHKHKNPLLSDFILKRPFAPNVVPTIEAGAQTDPTVLLIAVLIFL